MRLGGPRCYVATVNRHLARIGTEVEGPLTSPIHLLLYLFIFACYRDPRVPVVKVGGGSVAHTARSLTECVSSEPATTQCVSSEPATVIPVTGYRVIMFVAL